MAWIDFINSPALLYGLLALVFVVVLVLSLALAHVAKSADRLLDEEESQ